jgi:DNA-binding transcriptional LysR family regulator
MLLVPLDLLRTLVILAEERSYTRTASNLQMTQPAVSAQMKRLQDVLGVEIFDKSAPGVTLTAKGIRLVEHAHRMLAMNCEIFRLIADADRSRPLAIGIPAGLGGDISAAIFHRLRAFDLRLTFCTGSSTELLDRVQAAKLDLAIGLFAPTCAMQPRHAWSEEIVWAGARDWAPMPESEPVPLVMHASSQVVRAATVSLLSAPCSCKVVCEAADIAVLRTAVAAGVGVMPVARRFVSSDLRVIENVLPKFPAMRCGIFTGETVAPGNEAIVDAIFEALAPAAAVQRARSAEPAAA